MRYCGGFNPITWDLGGSWSQSTEKLSTHLRWGWCDLLFYRDRSRARNPSYHALSLLCHFSDGPKSSSMVFAMQWFSQ